MWPDEYRSYLSHSLVYRKWALSFAKMECCPRNVCILKTNLPPHYAKDNNQALLGRTLQNKNG